MPTRQAAALARFHFLQKKTQTYRQTKPNHTALVSEFNTSEGCMT